MSRGDSRNSVESVINCMFFNLMFRKAFLEHPKDQIISKSPSYADIGVSDNLRTHFPI